ncbi:hypothetical protein [Sphingobium nicotianae]|uniref:Kazal-like domain-containing protein n=1 Tax=Sphingobium nicotianae TaxID=2782607 RepID=A0A9X1AIU7_9SPHN|nr:hypothetical protein [Sphingobium nicotianae]MBT2185416.1 hypothetical protein [Sphingobium nicotianae]
MMCSPLPALGLAAALFLTGCMENMPRPERPPRPRPEKPIACTREYAPVCAAKGMRRKTFSNACMARVENYTVVRDGACGPDDH